MPSTFDHVIQLMPLPWKIGILVMIALIVLFAAFKSAFEGTTGSGTTGIHWNRICLFFVAALGLCGYFFWKDRAKSAVFQDGHPGLCVARLDGDPDDEVQEQIIQKLTNEFVHDSAIRGLKVDRCTDRPLSKQDAQNVVRQSHAIGVIWGKVTNAHGNAEIDLVWSQDKTTYAPTHFVYPQIDPFLHAISEVSRQHIQNAGIPAKPEDPEIPPPLPGFSEKHHGDRRGLFIGVDSPSALGPGPPYSAKDAEDVAKMFGQSQDGLVPRAEVLVNDRATREAVEEALRNLTNTARPDDQIWIYFSGMGFYVEGGGYLALEGASGGGLRAKSLSTGALKDWIRRLPSKQVVALIDARSGLAEQMRMHPFGKSREPVSDGKVWLDAGAYDELAREDNSTGHGVLTGFVLQGLTGKADRNGDGYISASELFRFVQNGIASSGGIQHPAMQIIEGAGDFVVFSLPNAPVM